jgi:hypothetical protein
MYLCSSRGERRCAFASNVCCVIAGSEDSESCENRNGAASALLHIDESDGVDKLNRQRNKNKRTRAEPRQVQTGTQLSDGTK